MAAGEFIILKSIFFKVWFSSMLLNLPKNEPKACLYKIELL